MHKSFPQGERGKSVTSAVPTCLTPNQMGLLKFGSGLSKSSFVLEPNESTFCPLNGSRPDESNRPALDYGDLSETFACAFGQSSWNGTSWMNGCAIRDWGF